MAERFTRPYVEALFAVAPPDAIAEMLPSLAAFGVTLAASASLQGFFRNPAVPRERKVAAVSSLAAQAGITGVGARLLQILLANRRLLQLPPVVRAIQERLDRDGNVVEAKLVTTAPLAEPDAGRLLAALEGRTRRTVRLTRTVDPALLGGFVVRVGSAVLDASLAHRLRKTRQALHGGAAAEGHHG